MKYLLPARTIAVALLLTCALPALPPDAAAQTNPTLTNVIPESAAVTLHATITAIDTGTRAVTLAGASGTAVTVTAGPLVRLDLLKVGDRVNAKYYRSIGFVVNPPAAGNGVTVSDNEIAQITAQQAQAPGGVGVRLTRVSGTVVGIDLAAHSVDLVNPSGGAIYTVDVTDPARVALLSTLKLGDTVTAVISQAVVVSIEPAPTSWF
jgi:Cu/Ag efflux protein CusF